MTRRGAASVALGLALVVQGCAGLIAGKDSADAPAVAPAGSVGPMAGSVQVEKGRPGIVLAAPHGTSDSATDLMGRELAKLTRFSLVVVTGYTHVDASGRGSTSGWSLSIPSGTPPPRPSSRACSPRPGWRSTSSCRARPGPPTGRPTRRCSPTSSSSRRPCCCRPRADPVRPIFTAAEMRALDARAIRDLGIPGFHLMDAAGSGAAALIGRWLAPIRGPRIAVVCGKGNNGGDGFVVARRLRARGAAVTPCLPGRRDQAQGDAAEALAGWRGPGAAIGAGAGPGALLRAPQRAPAAVGPPPRPRPPPPAP